MAYRFNPLTGNLDLIDPNVNADWNAVSGDAQILNKPTLGSLAALSSITNTEVAANAEIAVSKLADGAARQLLQTDAAGTGVEWTSNIDIPGTLDVTLAATFDSTVSVPLGSASAPSLFPGTDTNTGLWSPGPDTLALSTNGVERVRFSDTETRLNNDLNLNDGGAFTTTLQLVTPTANRTISFPDATGTVAFVGGVPGQLIYNNNGAYSGVSTLSFDGTILTLSGRLINTYNAAASAPAKLFSGTWFSGGTATTTKPHVLVEPSGTTSTNWSTAGTGLGVNAPSGFTGNIIDLQLNGSRVFSISSTGALTGTTSSLVSTTADGLRRATSYSTITYGATTNLDLAALDSQYRTISLTGNLTFTTSNLANGRTVVLRLVADGTARNLTFPAGWKFIGAKPTNIAASKSAILSLTFFGSADTDCIAAYGVEA